VVAFVVVLIAVLGVAAVVIFRGGAAWAVTLDGSTVVVMEGDEIRETKQLQVTQLPPEIQAELRRGKRVDDRAAAEAYINNITKRALTNGNLPAPGPGFVVTTTSGPVVSPGSTPSTAVSGP